MIPAILNGLMTRPVKVLQLCAVGFTIHHFLRPLIDFLQAKGCEVTVCCTPDEFAEQLRRAPFGYFPLKIERSMNAAAHWRAARELTAFLRRERFDVVHVHTPVAGLIGRFAAERARTPLVFYTAHGFYFHDAMPAVRRAFHAALERWAGRRTDFLFTQSDEDRRTAIRLRIMPPERVLTIGNGVDLGRFDPARVTPDRLANVRAELGLPAGAPVVTIMGRMVREKGFVEFFQAARIVAARHPEAHFLVIGAALRSDHDAAQAEIEAALQASGVRDRTHFAGLRRDVPELLALSTVYTLPSWREGMPRSIIEAMAMARPVVATNIRGCREEVVDGETGWLVPPRDAVALGAALVRILDDPERARAMGEAGRRRALALFDERLVLERQWAVYERLLREKGLWGR
ncbi:MAG: glycosyltransferase family 4 protein [Candidatus Sumerlaeia bacterium]